MTTTDTIARLEKDLRSAHQETAHLLEAIKRLGFDTESSASRQHYIDTGRFLTFAEMVDPEEMLGFPAVLILPTPEQLLQLGQTHKERQ